MRTFRKGGIHPKANKLTSEDFPVPMPVPDELRIMLSQNIGAPSKPIVKAGETITKNQMIAEPSGFVSAALHSPVNGTVKKIESYRNIGGIWQDCIVISPDKDDSSENEIPSLKSEAEIEKLWSTDIISIVREMGIVGLGGATFPTSVKLSVPKDKTADYVIINGAECEPFLTCDDIMMRKYPDKIVKGASLIMKATGAKKCVIGIEENKPDAIKCISEATKGLKNFKIEKLEKKYPQGSEKQLIVATTGKKVPAGGLPIDAGCIVDNVSTAAAIYDAVYLGLPLTERIVTVSGFGFKNPGNFLVKNGTSISQILDFAQLDPDFEGKILNGGPMMGRAISFIQATATKGMSGLTALPSRMTKRKDPLPCIRCAKCLNVCPMGLEPYLLMLMGENQSWAEVKNHGVMNCLECGCCSYVCPADRPILDYIRLGKQEVRKL